MAVTKGQALHNFWSEFGLPAYDETSVPDGAPFPRLTYSVLTDSWENTLLLNASLWWKSTSWEAISNKAEEIAKYIVHNLTPIPCEDGYVWINKGVPFAQRLGDPDDDRIRRILLTIQVEFLTSY